MPENENGTENTTEQAQTQQAPIVEQSNISAALEGLVSSKTLEELNKINTAPLAETEKSTTEAAAPEGQKPAGEQQAATEENSAAPEKKGDDEKPEKKNAFGITTKKAEKKSDIVIESVDNILEVVKSKYGQDIKDIKDLPKFFESVDKMRASAQKVEEVTELNNKYESILSGLPVDIINSIELFYQADDYMKAFNDKPKFNYDVPVEKQDSSALVNHYFPNKFTAEDFEEETPSTALEIAIQASQDKFNVEKQAKDNQRATVAQNATKQLESFKASVSSSVKNLTQSFPDADKNEIKGIQKILEGGANAIAQMFLNNDGTLKENAAKSLMMAIHGESVINDMSEAASHVTETKINEDLLSRSNESRKPKQGTGTTEQISEGAQKVLQSLGTFNSKKTF